MMPISNLAERERKGHKIRLGRERGIDRFTHAGGAESPTDRTVPISDSEGHEADQESQDSVAGKRNF